MVEDDLRLQFEIMLARFGDHALGLRAVAQQWLGDAAALKTLRETADPEIPILVAPDHVAVVTTDGLPHLATIKRAVGVARVGEHGARIAVVREPHFVALPELLDVGVGDGNFRIGIERGDGLGEKGGLQQIVAVERDEVTPARRAHPGVARVGEAAVGFLNEADAAVGIFRDQLARDGARLVRAAVVDDEQFPIGEGLREDARDGLGQEIGLAKTRDDDGDGGKAFGRGLRG